MVEIQTDPIEIERRTDSTVALYMIYEEAIYRLAGTDHTSPEDFADTCRQLGREFFEAQALKDHPFVDGVKERVTEMLEQETFRKETLDNGQVRKIWRRQEGEK